MSSNRKDGPRKPGHTGKGSPRKPPGRGDRARDGAAPTRFGGARPDGGRSKGQHAFKPPASDARKGRPPDGGQSRPRKDEGRKPPPRAPFAEAPAKRTEQPPRPPRAEGSGAAVGADTRRIAKVMARAGLCSRRDAEAWIEAGRVAVNGSVLTSPAVNVRDGDEIMVDGQPLAQQAHTRLFLFHKPRGLVTTDKDPEGRDTIFDFLRANWPDGPRVVSIGRLDINTEGLLLLTNDGGLARVLELPATGWLRRYRVRANGETDQGILDTLRAGVTIEGIAYAGIEATLDRVQGANTWLTLGLREGKNREIKRVLEHIGLAVNRLIRISFGPFQLGELEEGKVEEIRTRVLREQLGPALSQAAGADFHTPRDDTPEVVAHPPAREPRGKPRPAQPRALPDRDSRPPRFQPRPAAEAEDRAARAKPAPRPHKHISAMRAEAARENPEERKRIERSNTADRKGRTIAIERVVPVERRTERPAPSGRNARRFNAERNDGSASRTAGGGERPLHRRGAPQADRTETSRRESRGEARPHDSRHSTPRGERSAGRTTSGERPARRYDKKAAERPDRERRESRDGERSPARHAESRGERPAGKAASGGERTPFRHGKKPAGRMETERRESRGGERPQARHGESRDERPAGKSARSERPPHRHGNPPANRTETARREGRGAAPPQGARHGERNTRKPPPRGPKPPGRGPGRDRPRPSH